WANRMNFMETKKDEEERIYSNTDIIVEESVHNNNDNNNFIESVDDETDNSDYDLPEFETDDLFGLNFEDLDKELFSDE
ncbi:MAG: hypothetical protein WCQ84_06490, partial [Defluviitoga tunisiensis]